MQPYLRLPYIIGRANKHVQGNLRADTNSHSWIGIR
jgi:hypothetical protein